MRRFPLALLFVAAAVGLAEPGPRAFAQPKEAGDETFRTADGVELYGKFSPAAKTTDGGKKEVNARTAPVVVLLYEPGAGNDLTKGDWGTLTKKLNEDGYHVFQFDWRGHGKSTDIKDPERFWGVKSPYLNGTQANGAPNAFIKGGPGKPLKDKLSISKDVTNAQKFFPAYSMDLAAVRYHLDTKNDNGELNTSSIYLIGVGDTAGLGLAWLTMEWKRPAVKPGDNQLAIAGAAGAARYEYIGQELRGDFEEAGQDYAGAVWLSASRPAAISPTNMKLWTSKFAPQLRNNTPMLYLHGDKDTTGKTAADFFYSEVLVAKPKAGSTLAPLKQTFVRPLEGGGTDRGLKLLGNNAVKAEDTVLKFLKEVQKERQRTAVKQRKFDNNYGVNLYYFGLRTAP